MGANKQTRTSGWFGAVTVLAALALLAWVLSSVTAIYDRLATLSPRTAAAVIGVLLLGIIVLMGYGLHFMWAAGRAGRTVRHEPPVPTDPTAAAAESIGAARQQIDHVTDEIARRALSHEISSISDDLSENRYTIVVFGTGSSGKTAVINALLGGNMGLTDVLVGTTTQGAEHAYVVEGFAEGKLRLVDTPGLSEIGPGGLMREERARELATQADLLLFVVDQDLRDIEFQPLASLARLGKRSIIAFNKRDLYEAGELQEISRRLRQRASEIRGDVEVILCAAAPAPVAVRVAGRTPLSSSLGKGGRKSGSGDGAPAAVQPGSGASGETQAVPPDVTELADRIASILRAEGRSLLARNVLLRAAAVSDRARDLIHQARRDEAERIVTRFQWITAGVMFVNPVPGLGALAAAAINYQMVMEVAKVFGVSLTTESAKRLAGELAQVLLKMGVVNVATELLGKALKASIVGYLAGGAIEAVTGAYLSKLSGDTFIDYFAHDQNWGDGGMQGAIERRFKLIGQREFIADFIKEASQRVLTRERREP